MDRLQEWRVFAAVASERSFVKAARALGHSPQATTRAVMALEQRLGTRLLNRTTRSVSLTDSGSRLLEQCRRALADFDQLESLGSEGEPRGTLTVAAPVLFGELRVAPIVSDFLAANPLVSVRLQLLDRPVSLVDEGVDVAVRIGALADSTLRARLVGSVRAVVCASPDYLEQRGAPRRPEELASHSCISFTGTTPLIDRWSFRDVSGKERTIAVRPRLIANTGRAAIDAALAGVGLVRVLSYQVEELLLKRRLEVVLQRFEREPVPVHILQPPGAPVRAASLFVEVAAERLRAGLGLDRMK